MTKQQRIKNDTETSDRREMEDKTIKDSRDRNDELTKENRLNADKTMNENRVKNDALTDYRRELHDRNPTRDIIVTIIVLVVLALGAYFLFT